MASHEHANGVSAAPSTGPQQAWDARGSAPDATAAADENEDLRIASSSADACLCACVRNNPRAHAAASKLIDAVASWFSSGHTVDTRSAAQLEREKWLLWHPSTGRFHRLWIILPVILCQAVIGSLYSWSIFNKQMDSGVWGSPGVNARAFMICVAFYGLGALLLGNWVERCGPSIAVSRTVLLTPLGWAAAALGSYTHNVAIVYAGFGICHGFGTACTYLSTCSMMQKHFPELKGFAAGLAVMGFGIGSFVFTTVGKSLLDPHGPYAYPVWQVQLLFAIVFAAILAACWPIMRLPPPGWTPPTLPPLEPLPAASSDPTAAATAPPHTSWKQRLLSLVIKRTSLKPLADRHYTFLQAATQLEFGLLCILVFGFSMPGVVFLSSAADMTQNLFGFDAGFAGTITALMNAANFTGRFSWGWVSDRLGRKTFYMLATLTQAFAVGLMSVWIHQRNFGAWLLSFLLIGSLYGGSFGVLPAFVSDLFGSNISAATHGVMIACWALSSVVGTPIFTSITSTYTETVGGVLKPTAEAYVLNAYWLVVMPVISCIAAVFLNVHAHDRTLRKARKHARVRLGPYVCVCDCKLLDPTAQEVEYASFMKDEQQRLAERAGSAVEVGQAQKDAHKGLAALTEGLELHRKDGDGVNVTSARAARQADTLGSASPSRPLEVS